MGDLSILLNVDTPERLALEDMGSAEIYCCILLLVSTSIRQWNLLKIKLFCAKRSYWFERLVNDYLVLLSTSFGSPHVCMSLSSTTGIGLSVNNFLTGSSISPFPDTARLMLSHLQCFPAPGF